MSVELVTEEDAVIRMADDLGTDDPEMAELAQALRDGDYRPWLIRQGLMTLSQAAKLSDAATKFFAAGAMSASAKASAELEWLRAQRDYLLTGITWGEITAHDPKAPVRPEGS